MTLEAPEPNEASAYEPPRIETRDSFAEVVSEIPNSSPPQ